MDGCLGFVLPSWASFIRGGCCEYIFTVFLEIWNCITEYEGQIGEPGDPLACYSSIS